MNKYIHKYDRHITVMLYFIDLNIRKQHQHANMSALKCA